MMARPNVRIQEEGPIKVVCGEPFDVQVFVTAYNPGEVIVCLELPEDLPCSFVGSNGERRVKQICKTVEATADQGKFTVNFKLTIDCDVKDRYTTEITASVVDSAGEKSRKRSEILRIVAAG
ncbi:hypothetical protein ACFL6S_37895 [Candidatus Poribacteria bacterium]